MAHAHSVGEAEISRRFDQKPTLFKTDPSSVADPGELEQVESMWDKVFGAMVEKGKLIAFNLSNRLTVVYNYRFSNTFENWPDWIGEYTQDRPPGGR